MNNKVLHIIPDNGRYTKMIEDTPMSKKDNAYMWYLHGELDSMLGFDKGVVVNCDELNILKPFNYEGRMTYNKMHIEGEYECKVEGVNEPCIGFFYVDERGDNLWTQRGLVCLKSDEKGCKYAKEKMIEKSLIL